MMKKVIASCIAMIFVAILHKAYIFYTPLTVSFDIQTEKNINLEVKYASKVGQPFKVDVGTFRGIRPHERHVVIELPITRMYKFRIDPGDMPGKVVLRNVKVVSGRKEIRFDDFSKFEFRNIENISYADGRLEFTSSLRDPHFWFNSAFKFKGELCVDWHILSILSITLFLLSYGVVYFCSSFFVSRSKKEMGSILFCTVFCVLLAIPVMNMDNRDILPEENRKLAVFPRLLLSENKGFNYQFGKEFDAWMQDRFTARRSFIKRYYNAKYFINGFSENERAIRYTNNWMFDKRWTKGIFTPYEEPMIKRGFKNLIRLNNFCKNHDIDMFVLILPIKEDIYSRFNYNYKNNKVDRITLIKDLFYKNGISYVYPREVFKRASYEYPLLCFKSDTHLTEYGGYLAHKSLIESLRLHGYDVTMPNISNFDITKNKKVRYGDQNSFVNGHILNLLNINNTKYLDHEYEYYTCSNKITSNENKYLERYFYNKKGRYSAFLLGCSFTETQSVWMQHSFNKLLKIRINNGYSDESLKMARWERKMVELKPDLLILCFNAHDAFIYLSGLYKD